MGFLSLFSTGHLLLAATAIGFVVFTARPPLAKVLAVSGFGLGVAGGWLALGQSLPGLGLWLQRGVPLLWSTSPAWRLVDLEPFGPWALICTLGFAMVLIRYHGSAPERQRSLPGVLFLGAAAWLAWKTLALQAHGMPLGFLRDHPARRFPPVASWLPDPVGGGATGARAGRAWRAVIRNS